MSAEPADPADLLTALALADPAELATLRDINGVGDRKLERYGAEVLETLAAVRQAVAGAMA